MTSINMIPKRKFPSKVCPRCYAVAHAARLRCDLCEHVFATSEKTVARAAMRALNAALSEGGDA